MHEHDDQRMERIGMPEAVLCSAKTQTQLRVIAEELAARSEPILFTRLSQERFDALPDAARLSMDYDSVSETATLHGCLVPRRGKVAVVAAGTSDQQVATEAARTLEFSGVETNTIVDVGVAGIWRLEARLDEIRAADIVIAVAGMDAAIVSVLGGLIGAPIIAVPTSVGYGVAAGGTTALNSALASCAQGVAVMNIDNGFGAACAAIRMLSLLGPKL
ncbi:MAG: nickel pincer cofactor biosynthesis protein LarB [Acidimicrobiales bacterium]|jgi:NCAIR mutase (PurE)-related protein